MHTNDDRSMDCHNKKIASAYQGGKKRPEGIEPVTFILQKGASTTKTILSVYTGTHL